jgi:uncharacterized protein
MTFDWTLYTGNLKWLPRRTIYVTRHGSHAYGTNIATSDQDFRGIAVAPMPYYLGFTHVFEQAVQNSPVDLTIFELQKFMKLAADANPNALEILFTDPSDHLYVSPVMKLLFDAREAFLSTKCKHTFSGYARSQLKRIQGHYRWLKKPPQKPPERADFGLPERTVIPADQLAAAQAAISKQMDRWNWRELEGLDNATRIAVKEEFERSLLEITQWHWSELEDKKWLSAARTIGLDENFIRLMDLERQYTARLREWQQYRAWKVTRNIGRSALEAEHGYDTKHASHLVRLTRMCRELLETGKVNVRRPDAEELLFIRNGGWTYEGLIEYSNREDAAMDELVKTSKLPHAPDRERLDELCLEIIKRMANP